MEQQVTLTCLGYLTGTTRARINLLRKDGYEVEAQMVDDANRGIREDEPYVHFVERRQVNGRPQWVSHWSTGELKPFEARPRCGYDFQRTVAAAPPDGAEREYTCPQCGVRGIFRPPNAKED